MPDAQADVRIAEVLYPTRPLALPFAKVDIVAVGEVFLAEREGHPLAVGSLVLRVGLEYQAGSTAADPEGSGDVQFRLGTFDAQSSGK